MHRILLVFALCLTALAQTVGDPTDWKAQRDIKPMLIPASAADVFAYDVRVDRLYLANTTAAAVTVTITDKTTNCNSAACAIWPTVSIAANSVYAADLGGVWSPGGVRWVASSANAVVGYLRVRYVP